MTRDSFDHFYPLPDVGPFDDIRQYRTLLIAAVDAELNRSDVWSAEDEAAALGYVQDLKAWLVEFEPVTIPVGMLAPFAGDIAPPGWLLCDGSPVPRDEHAALFAVIGTVYGAGNGTTTFNLPDLRGRVPAGSASGWALGAQLGAETHTLTVNEIPSHAHERQTRTSPTGFGTSAIARANTTGSLVALAGFNTGGDAPHNNVQPTLVVNYIIRV